MNFYKLSIIFFISLAFTFPLRANDSIPFQSAKQWSIFTAGATFTTIGTVSNSTFNKFNIAQQSKQKHSAFDAIQYAPLAFPWAMKALGVPTRSGWNRMATSQALSTLLMAGSVSLLKDNTPSLRPDGTDMRSFPSGHSAWAYLGATMTAYELGWKSPWYSFGAYSIASTVAMQRIIDQRHLPKDVIAGAGIGILSAQIGYLFGDLIWGNKQIDNYFEDIKTPHPNPNSISLINTYSIPLNKFYFNDFTISISPGFEAGVKWHAPIYNKMSLATTISFMSSPIFMEKGNLNLYIAPLNRLRINIAPSYHFNISNTFSIDMEAGCIYNQNFSLKSQERAISINKNSIGGFANIITSMRITDNLSIGANIGYEISPNKIYLNQSKPYGINYTDKKSNVINTLNIGLSTIIDL